MLGAPMERKRCTWGALVAITIGACTSPTRSSTTPRLAHDDDAPVRDAGLEALGPDVSQCTIAVAAPVEGTERPAREHVAPDDDADTTDALGDDASTKDARVEATQGHAMHRQSAWIGQAHRERTLHVLDREQLVDRIARKLPRRAARGSSRPPRSCSPKESARSPSKGSSNRSSPSASGAIHERS
jgi:hypothetical protein